MKEYGRFQADGSYLISDPKPPRLWWNFHWSTDGYFLGVNQAGAGYSKYLDEKGNRNDVSGGFDKDKTDKHIYLRDEVTLEPWSPTSYPIPGELEEFSCVQAVAFTEFRSVRSGIASRLRCFVPVRGFHEIWTVSLENRSKHRRAIGVYPALQWELSGFPVAHDYIWHSAFSVADFEPGANAVICINNNPKKPHARYIGYLAASLPVSSFECAMDDFYGPLHSVGHPEALYTLNQLGCSPGGNISRGAALQVIMELDPGEVATVHFMIGVAESRDEVARLVADNLEDASVEKAFQEVVDYYRSIHDRIILDLPDERLNILANSWLKKQMRYTLVGKQGLRDNLQIADAYVMVDRETAEREILKAVGYQYKDGHTIKSWFPWVETYYSDGPIWIVMAVVGLLKETGDRGLLNMRIPYVDGGEGDLYEHLCRAVDRLWEDRGPHMLCLARYADWNDDLNMDWNPRAESVWTTMGLGYMLWEMKGLAEWKGDSAYAADLSDMHDQLRKDLEIAWDGRWYKRAFSDDFEYGTSAAAEGKIFVNPQTWAVMGHIAEGDRATMVAAAVDELLESDYGSRVCWPPYSRFDPRLGAISALTPGHGTNGSSYCHVSGFKMVMDCMLGRGEQAYRTMRRIMPDGDNPSTQTGSEPYGFTNMYMLTRTHYGECYQSWMTGTAGWAFKALVEWMVGLRREYEGLLIDPCVPPSWKRFKASRLFRGARYDVEFENPEGVMKGVEHIAVDGREIDGNILPVLPAGASCKVVVRMGNGEPSKQCAMVRV
jgi:cellobiose phosphorylase